MESGLDGTLAALSDPVRRAVVELLRAEPRRPSEIADALGVSRPAMSRHLLVLRRAGLVEGDLADEDGRARVYHLRREPFEDLRGWLDEMAAFWGEQLEGFRAHVERGSAGRRR